MTSVFWGTDYRPSVQGSGRDGYLADIWLAPLPRSSPGQTVQMTGATHLERLELAYFSAKPESL